MKWVAVIGMVLGALAFASAAEARPLPYLKAYRAVLLDSIAAKQDVSGADDYDIGVGQRVGPGRVVFPVLLEGDELIQIIPGYSTPNGGYEPHRSIYEHFYCTWRAIAKWQGKAVIVLRRSVRCQEWEDESVSQ